jgi:hypothetical protein
MSQGKLIAKIQEEQGYSASLRTQMKELKEERAAIIERSESLNVFIT